MITEYYRQQLERGQEFQDFILTQLLKNGIPVCFYSSRKYQFEKGESSNGIEVKFDDRYNDTKNLYIEYAEKSNPNNKNYVPSGIERTDNTWLYLIGNYSIIFIFAKSFLKGLKNTSQIRHVKTSTSQGYLLPELMAIKYAAKIIKC